MAHAFSTRIDRSGLDFDLGTADGTDPRVRARRLRFASAAGLGDAPLAILGQVHGRAIVSVDDLGDAPVAADGALRSRRSASPMVPAVRSADCVPLLLVDPRGRATAAVHAGWRGTAAGIAAAAVERMRALGAGDGLVVALGPAILGCCYEVGEEVVAALGTPEAVARRRPGELPKVDLHAANVVQLLAAGVRREDIHRAPWCTRCRNDLFFSARAEGARAGRLMAAAGPAARP